MSQSGHTHGKPISRKENQDQRKRSERVEVEVNFKSEGRGCGRPELSSSLIKVLTCRLQVTRNAGDV